MLLELIIKSIIYKNHLDTQVTLIFLLVFLSACRIFDLAADDANRGDSKCANELMCGCANERGSPFINLLNHVTLNASLRVV